MTVVTWVWALVYGTVSAVFFFVLQPVCWLLIGIPAVVCAAVFDARSHDPGYLLRQLRRQRSRWRSRWHYHFARIGWMLRGARRRAVRSH